jgi:hypothetical protein
MNNLYKLYERKFFTEKPERNVEQLMVMQVQLKFEL